MSRGYYVRPVVFSDVRNDMRIAREEIFGPVLCIIPYDTVEEAVSIANDTPYGLSGYVHAPTKAEAVAVAKRIHSGNVYINDARATSPRPSAATSRAASDVRAASRACSNSRSRRPSSTERHTDTCPNA